MQNSIRLGHTLVPRWIACIILTTGPIHPSRAPSSSAIWQENWFPTHHPHPRRALSKESDRTGSGGQQSCLLAATRTKLIISQPEPLRRIPLPGRVHRGPQVPFLALALPAAEIKSISASAAGFRRPLSRLLHREINKLFRFNYNYTIVHFGFSIMDSRIQNAENHKRGFSTKIWLFWILFQKHIGRGINSPSVGPTEYYILRNTKFSSA